MKLKKIASLMLAGVMAVSMLAGCSGNGGNGGNGGEGEGQVDTDSLSAASIIAELNKNTTEKVTFSANSSLENALSKAVSVVGSDNATNAAYAGDVATTAAKIAKLDLVNSFTFPAAEKDQDLDAETRIWGMVIPAADFSEKIAVDLFAEMVDQKVEDLETYNQYKVASKTKVADGDTYTKYSYTGNIAVVKVEDITTGYTGYIGVVTVTCTPAEATASL